MARSMWVRKVIKAGFPYRSLGARMTRVPLLGTVIERALFGGDEIFIVPRGRLIAVDEGPAEEEHVVLPWQVVERFVERASHLWIMDRCICRDASGCSEYPVDLGCLFMGEAVLEINPALGRIVTRQEALDHLARCRQAGLFHLLGRNRLDSVWLGAKPADRLLTVCNCCTCCCLWRILPHVSAGVSSSVSRLPGLVVSVTGECAGCGECERICMARAARVEGGHSTIDPGACIGCGRCVEVCRNGAIEIRLEDPRAVEAAVARIESVVHVGE